MPHDTAKHFFVIPSSVLYTVVTTMVQFSITHFTYISQIRWNSFSNRQAVCGQPRSDSTSTCVAVSYIIVQHLLWLYLYHLPQPSFIYTCVASSNLNFFFFFWCCSSGQFRAQILCDQTMFSCDRCQKVFQYKGSLSRHRWKCERLRVLTCTLCTKEFFRMDVLKEHVMTVHKTVPTRYDSFI